MYQQCTILSAALELHHGDHWKEDLLRSHRLNQKGATFGVPSEEIASSLLPSAPRFAPVPAAKELYRRLYMAHYPCLT